MTKDSIFKNLSFRDSSSKKKKTERSKSVYSVVSLSEVTEGALQVWRALPETIRQDPSLASFRQEHERQIGEYFFFLISIDAYLFVKDCDYSFFF